MNVKEYNSLGAFAGARNGKLNLCRPGRLSFSLISGGREDALKG